MCVLHNFIWCNMLMCLFSIRGHKGLGFAKSELKLFPFENNFQHLKSSQVFFFYILIIEIFKNITK
jgi:hypothetical protein